MATREMREYTERSSIKGSFTQQEIDPDDQNVIYKWMQKIPKRYVVAFLAFLGFCNAYALRVNLSVAIVAMVNNRTTNVNGTYKNVADFNWDSRLQGLVLSSFFYGYIVTQLPGGWAASRFGGKHLFGLGILVTAVLTLITPWASRISVYFLIAIRVVEGLAEGVTYPAIHAIWSKWAPPLERSKLATVGFSGSYAGTVISMLLSGVIADTIGWTWIFYIFGALGIAWYFAWMIIATETPSKYENISQDELEYITHSIGFTEAQTKGRETPWGRIFLSLPVWAIIFAHFAENWGFYTLLTELPTFLNDMLGYNIARAGFVAALPYLVMTFMVQIGGQLADLLRKKGILSTTSARKLFTCGAFLFQTTFMLITAYMMKPVAAVACITVAVGFGGFAWAGFSVNHLDIAPQYASILMGVTNTFATIPGIVSPYLTGQLVTHKTAAEWRIIFYIAAGVYCAGSVVYALIASGEKQKWADVPVGYEPHYDTAETETEVETED